MSLFLIGFFAFYTIKIGVLCVLCLYEIIFLTINMYGSFFMVKLEDVNMILPRLESPEEKAKFCVIEAKDKERLVTMINKLIIEGLYKPVGGIVVECRDGVDMYCQSMSIM